MHTEAIVYRFGPYELRPKTRVLYKHGTRLKLRPQPFQVLQILADRAGDPVPREELNQLLWARETFVDFEQGLNTVIKELRRALNDSATRPRYLETLPKVGYRMLIAVQRIEAPNATPAALPVLPERNAVDTSAVKQVPKRLSRRRLLSGRTISAAAAIFAAALATAGIIVWSHQHNRSEAAARRITLAVLPFENLTGDPAQEYFGDGLTEEMISQIARVDPQRIGVIGRASAMRYRRSHESLEHIGAELGADYVIEGSVRRNSAEVRISAELIRVKDRRRVWAREYDRELSTLLALQTEIAQEIGDEIRVATAEPPRYAAAQPSPASEKVPYEVYDLYLNGLYFWNKRTPNGFQQAADYFQQAIAKDPNYARAYAGLANTYGMMCSWYMVPQDEFVPKAREAALHALQLDDTLAEAHTALAVIAQNHDYDWQTAEREYRDAIALDPSYATAHQWYAEFLSLHGRFDEALAESERARKIDPLSLIIAADQGVILYYARRYDQSIEQLRSVLDMDPNFTRAHLIVFAYVQAGRFAEAVADIQKWRRLDDTPATWGDLAYVYGRWGRTVEAQRAMAHFQMLAKRNPQWDPTPQLLLAYIGMAKRDEAIALLQKADADHSNVVTALKVEPAFDPLRPDPRFQDLLRQMHFPN